MSNFRDPVRQSRPGGEAAGFTLVEVLLALAITGILFAGVFMALDQAMQQRNLMSNKSTPYTLGPAILDRIAQDLSNAFFYDIKNNNAFYGVSSELDAEEADAMSFLTTSRTYMPEQYRSTKDMRHSYLNEVAYVMRRDDDSRGRFRQLWRREDFFVDDYPHAGGDFVLLYDKVKAFRIQYVSRNPETEGDVAGPSNKESEEMLQDDWNAIREQGVPRAVQVTLEIYAPDDHKDVWEKAVHGEARTYLFKRFIALPQIHVSREAEQAVANWDGALNEGAGVTTGRNVRGGAQTAVAGGAGARNARGGGADEKGGRNARGGQGGRRGMRQGGSNRRAGASNPFLQALKNSGRRPSGGSSGNPFSSLFNR